MPKAQLLTSSVKRLAGPVEGKDQILYWDHGHKEAVRGLGLRVTANGTRTFIVRGYPGGQERRINLVATIHKPIEEVRAEADEKRVAMNKDIDLREQERREREAQAAASLQNEADVVTLRAVMDEYLKNQTGRTGKPLREATKRDIERHVTVNLADWADKPLKALTKDRVTEVFRKLHERAPSQASQCMTVLRGLINRARERYVGDEDEYLLHPVNPVTRLFGKHGLLKMHKDKARTTRIPRAKIGAVWAMLQRRRAEARTVDERASADWVCMVLVTGCRRTESGSLLWENVNLDEGWFHLPSDVVKNHNGITLPLSKPLKDILSARKAMPVVHDKALRRRKEGRPVRERSAYVFPSWGKEGHITDARATMEAVSEVAGLHLGLHDLRRTAETVATICGVDADLRRRLLNHIDTDVHGRHYGNDTDHAALADAVESIASWIVKQGEIAEAMLSGANVVALRG